MIRRFNIIVETKDESIDAKEAASIIKSNCSPKLKVLYSTEDSYQKYLNLVEKRKIEDEWKKG